MFEKLKKNASSLLVLFALISSLFYAFNVLAWQSDLNDLEQRVIFNEEAAKKKELMKTVFECKKLYGSDYASAPDEFTAKFCRDAEIELKNMK